MQDGKTFFVHLYGIHWHLEFHFYIAGLFMVMK
jgi:hypothetical protein